jgi:hypothetical protein
MGTRNVEIFKDAVNWIITAGLHFGIGPASAQQLKPKIALYGVQ